MNRHLILLVLAIVFAVIFTLVGFNVFDSSDKAGWLGLAIVTYFLSLVP